MLKLKKFARFTLILTMGVFIGVAVTLEKNARAERAIVSSAIAPLPYSQLRTFTEIFSRIKSDYVEKVDDKTLLQNAIRGMLSGLDPHSSYLDKVASEEIRISTDGKFGGLGIEVTMEDGFIKVVTPIDDTPAARAGLQPGDLIVRLNTKPVKGMTLGDAVKIMRGKPGSKIILIVVREGEGRPLEFTLTRAIIKIVSVKSRLLEPGYGYVRISAFQISTGKSLANAILKLHAKNKGPLKGLVLDLRNNPGGVLDAAVQVSDTFLTKGLIVYTEGRTSNSKHKFRATPNDLIQGAPIVVLVNEGSASASEIVAGALQDHKRAVIMGTKTFGKGSVQTIVPMSNGTKLKLTTARYFTPKGRSIQAKGVIPDIITEQVEIKKKKQRRRLKEADLSRHLKNTGAGKEKLKKSKAASKAKRDFQLNEALNLLKGVNLFQKRAG
ncbi:MAG TPA: S41 family peptidase [Acidiferrobacteraceae bacterium]|nr:S41 family peptidase [Acidiferrobacteraceae bacterium]HEX19282.1 S41 family peptidase [Acidiferrobacteraceae bacterium]